MYNITMNTYKDQGILDFNFRSQYGQVNYGSGNLSLTGMLTSGPGYGNIDGYVVQEAGPESTLYGSTDYLPQSVGGIDVSSLSTYQDAQSRIYGSIGLLAGSSAATLWWNENADKVVATPVLGGDDIVIQGDAGDASGLDGHADSFGTLSSTSAPEPDAAFGTGADYNCRLSLKPEWREWKQDYCVFTTSEETYEAAGDSAVYSDPTRFGKGSMNPNRNTLFGHKVLEVMGPSGIVLEGDARQHGYGGFAIRVNNQWQRIQNQSGRLDGVVFQRMHYDATKDETYLWDNTNSWQGSLYAQQNSNRYTLRPDMAFRIYAAWSTQSYYNY